MRIEYEDVNHITTKRSPYEISEAYLTESDAGLWAMVIFLNTMGDAMYEDTAVFLIENQNDVYRLNALL